MALEPQKSVFGGYSRPVFLAETAQNPAASPQAPQTLSREEPHFQSTLTELLEEAEAAYAKKVFVRIRRGAGYHALTYGDLARRSLELMSGLREAGVRAGARIAIASDNSPEWVIAFFAAVRLGAACVPVDPKLTERELAALLADCAPDFVFCSDTCREKIERAAASLPAFPKIRTMDDGPSGWTSLFRTPSNLPDAAPAPGDCAAILYTSGTTGRPKGVMLTHGNLACEARTLAAFGPTRSTDRILALLPLFHVYSLSTLLVFLAAGARTTFQNQLKGPEILDALREDRCTMIVAVPRLYEIFCKTIRDRIRESPVLKRAAFSALRALSRPAALFGLSSVRRLFRSVHENFGGHLVAMVSGGGRLDPEVGRFLTDVGFVMQEGYGLTETCGAVTLNRFGRGKAGTVGEIIPETSLSVENPGPDGVGEILLKGPTVFKGYYGREDLTLEVLKDGWFRTGDLGRLEEGYLVLTGRKKDMIALASGKKVYPDEVEDAYGQSPLIRQIGVVGADRGRGEEVFAFLVPKLEAFTEEERQSPSLLEARLKDEIARISSTLSPHKRITQYRIVSEELPRTPLGKIKRHELRRWLDSVEGAKMSGAAAEEDDLTRHVIGIVRRSLSGHVPENIAADSHLELDLGMDSLSRTELVTALEKAFKISVPDQEILDVQTVGDIAQILRRHNGGGVTPSAEESLTGEFRAHPAIPDRLDFSKQGQQTRLDWIRQKTGADVSLLAHSGVNPESLKGNIEHFIGMAQVPVGLAGPVLIDGDAAQGAFYVPLATTEGALVASVTRGMMAITYSGGARARVLDDQVMRAPTWIFERGRQAEVFIDWLKENYGRIKAAAESTTRSGKLKDLQYIPNGRRVTVRFLFTSGDASGQNMVTMATHAACAFINKEQPVRGLVQHFLENNLSGDKKMSMVNILSARGKKVYADAVIKKDVLRHFLHTTPEDLAAFSKEGALGSMQAGIYGTNAQYANVLAAIFIATGQDVACTHEASTGLTVVDLTPEGDLYISVTLPNVIVATVGGGTGKGTQRECLEILGCAGSGKVNRLAEIIAASVLAGELSISGAHAAGDFAQAHDKLGRNRPGAGRNA